MSSAFFTQGQRRTRCVCVCVFVQCLCTCSWAMTWYLLHTAIFPSMRRDVVHLLDSFFCLVPTWSVHKVIQTAWEWGEPSSVTEGRIGEVLHRGGRTAGQLSVRRLKCVGKWHFSRWVVQHPCFCCAWITSSPFSWQCIYVLISIYIYLIISLFTQIVSMCAV